MAVSAFPTPVPTEAITPRHRAALPHNTHGLSLYGRGDSSGAMVCFELALGLDPSYPEGYNNRGLSRQQLGDLEGALADFDRALALHPRYPEAYNNRARLRQIQGDLPGALADLDCALECVPRQSAALYYYNRGAVREAVGDLLGALQDFDHVLAITPVHGLSWFRRGVVRKRLGNLPGALTDLDQALARSPKSACAAILHERGHIRRLQGEIEGAIRDYDTALALEPNSVDILISRANARYLRRDSQTAADYLSALRINEIQAARLIARIVLEDAQRDELGVFENCRQYLRLNPNDPVGLGRLGLSLLALGRDQAARHSLERLQQLLPEAAPYLERVVAEVRRIRG